MRQTIKYTCRQCGAEIDRDLWMAGEHDPGQPNGCPATAKPISGESREDYSKRSDAHRARWLAAKAAKAASITILKTACCNAFDTYWGTVHTCRKCHRSNPEMIEVSA